MLRLLGPRGHAVVDYLTWPTLLLAARRARLRGSAARWAHAFVLLILSAVLFTRTPVGLVRLVPFRWHGHAEAASVVVQYLLPFTAGFRGDARGKRFFTAFASYNLLVWLLTDFDMKERDEQSR